MPQDTAPRQTAFERQWHYKPDVPIKVSPFFSWPPDPARMRRWIIGNWFALSENLILVALALLVWALLSPSLETASSLAPGWVLGIYLRNLVLMCIVAGGLHWYFHGQKRQGSLQKFDPREIAPHGRMFTLGSQLRDNMFWTLTFGVGFWTLYEMGMLHAMGNGWIPALEMDLGGMLWCAVLLLLTPLWISFHFYWIHRALHWPPLYRLAHAVHHRNTNIGPWSGLSMHPIECALFFSSVLIHLVVASHPVVILFHLMHQALTAATSHTGFENLVMRDKERLSLGRFHHQMHHRYFECNYGNLEVPWDVVFGSFHDGTQEAHDKMKARNLPTGG